MTRRSVRERLQDIATNAAAAASFVEGMPLTTFLGDLRTQYAVIRGLEIIGEAARYVPKAMRESNADIPWERMIAMRNRIIHGYDTTDLTIVYKTAASDLPAVLPRIEALIASISPGDGA